MEAAQNGHVVKLQIGQNGDVDKSYTTKSHFSKRHKMNPEVLKLAQAQVVEMQKERDWISELVEVYDPEQYMQNELTQIQSNGSSYSADMNKNVINASLQKAYVCKLFKQLVDREKVRLENQKIQQEEEEVVQAQMAFVAAVQAEAEPVQNVIEMTELITQITQIQSDISQRMSEIDKNEEQNIEEERKQFKLIDIRKETSANKKLETPPKQEDSKQDEAKLEDETSTIFKQGSDIKLRLSPVQNEDGNILGRFYNTITSLVSSDAKEHQDPGPLAQTGSSDGRSSNYTFQEELQREVEIKLPEAQQEVGQYQFKATQRNSQGQSPANVEPKVEEPQAISTQPQIVSPQQNHQKVEEHQDQSQDQDEQLLNEDQEDCSTSKMSNRIWTYLMIAYFILVGSALVANMMLPSIDDTLNEYCPRLDIFGTLPVQELCYYSQSQIQNIEEIKKSLWRQIWEYKHDGTKSDDNRPVPIFKPGQISPEALNLQVVQPILQQVTDNQSYLLIEKLPQDDYFIQFEQHFTEMGGQRNQQMSKNLLKLRAKQSQIQTDYTLMHLKSQASECIEKQNDHFQLYMVKEKLNLQTQLQKASGGLSYFSSIINNKFDIKSHILSLQIRLKQDLDKIQLDCFHQLDDILK